eukprot:7993806-Heterocapsa_arctica.AAC.1
MEKYLAREYARELWARSYPVAKGRLNAEGTPPKWAHTRLEGAPPRILTEEHNPRAWKSDQDYPPEELGNQLRIPNHPRPAERGPIPGETRPQTSQGVPHGAVLGGSYAPPSRGYAGPMPREHCPSLDAYVTDNLPAD